ncbi:transposase [Rhodococcus opacus]|uniref:transposase n=1 Tax=Rhodococcus opacus TaxID=37919 RepID=UPI0018C8BC2B|nr:transposase [Rhodococcus opacus]
MAKAIAANLPHAAISVDAFHLVKLANNMVTTVRQRISRQQRIGGAGWSIRRRRTDGSCYAVRTPLRLAAGRVCGPRSPAMIRPRNSPPPGASKNNSAPAACPNPTASGPHMPVVAGDRSPDRHRCHAKTEAANTGIKNIKRIGRGFRNAKNYRARILLTRAAHSAA